MSLSDRLHRPLVIGEALFDVLPGGTETLGGAPFNVAWHLHAFGLRPIFVSRVGKDDRGRRILDRMAEWGMDRSGIQTDYDHPTGEVIVSLKNGEPDFRIVESRAYDYVEWMPVAEILKRTPISLIYHGTLAGRTEAADRVISRLVREAATPVFLDVNLRQGCWEIERVLRYMRSARWVKMNEAELRVLGFDTKADDAARRFFHESDAEMLILTKGAEGAELRRRSGVALRAKPPAVKHFADAIGAGDAFSAVAIKGLIEAWPDEVILSQAVRFASTICGIRGAIPLDPSFYEGAPRSSGEDKADSI